MSAVVLQQTEPLSWRTRLYERLRGRAYPLFSFGNCIVPAAATWAGARLWTTAFRAAGLVPGDRIVLALAPDVAFVQVLVAALWEGYTIIPVVPPAHTNGLTGILETFDARCAVADRAYGLSCVWVGTNCEGPQNETVSLRAARHVPTPEARFLLSTSGTTARPGMSGRSIALSDANVLSVLDSHLPHLGLHEAESRVLSILPWCHAFGLVLDLLAALLAGAEISVPVVPKEPGGFGPRSLEAVCEAGEQMQVTHLNMVPLVAARLGQTVRGYKLLQSLKGGIVGGAPIGSEVADLLATTRLRVGYGLTEAGPGVALGEPGIWPGANYLGQPLGCETLVAVSDDAPLTDKRNPAVAGELFFRGPNAHLGEWTAQEGFHTLPPNRWVATGDLVQEDDGLFFAGRRDDAFKLANGRRVEAGVWENRLREGFPALSDVLLYSPDGQQLAALVSITSSKPAQIPTVKQFSEALGPLGARFANLRVVPTDFWVRTPKGTRIRAACLARLGNVENAL